MKLDFKKTIPLTRGLSWILVALTLVSIGSLQLVFDRSAAPFEKAKKKSAIMLAEPLVPTPNAIRALSMGNQLAVADLLWLQTIQYFGQGSPYGNYPSLGKLLDTITQVDPKYQYPYEFGMIVLPFMNQTDAAVKLGERAQINIPNNGLLTYYLATVFHLNVKDYKRASELYELASKQPNAPGAAQLLAATALSQYQGTIDDRQAAIDFWQTVYQNAKTDEDRERAANWFAQMQIVKSIEIAAQQYKNANGRYPNDIQELVDGKYIQQPVSPVKRLFVLDPNTGKVDFSQMDSSQE